MEAGAEHSTDVDVALSHVPTHSEAPPSYATYPKEPPPSFPGSASASSFPGPLGICHTSSSLHAAASDISSPSTDNTNAIPRVVVTDLSDDISHENASASTATERGNESSNGSTTTATAARSTNSDTITSRASQAAEPETRRRTDVLKFWANRRNGSGDTESGRVQPSREITPSSDVSPDILLIDKGDIRPSPKSRHETAPDMMINKAEMATGDQEGWEEINVDPITMSL